jgi:hypothetical protein
MTKDEALKMAIEWLDKEPKSMEDFEAKENAINACKEALEQPAQEPVAYNFEGVLFFANEASHYMKDSGQPLYTHPHQWQELTDDENEAIIQSIWEWGNDFPYDEYRICIEQALRIKNDH